MPKWFISSIEITGGFLPGVSLQLPRGLTCIIGPRGSGKSTLAEAFRYGIGGLGRAANGALVQANLNSSVITIVTSPEAGELAYTIRRAFKQPAALVTSEGKSVESLDLDRGTFLPLDAYNSEETEAIANETLGEKRRSLIDELREVELREIGLVLGELRRALQANADGISAARRSIQDLTEQIEEMGDARSRLAALPPAPVGAVSEQLLRLTQVYQATEADLRELDEAVRRIENWKAALLQFNREQKERLAIPTPRQNSVNASAVSDAGNAVSALIESADDHFQQLESRLAAAVETLQNCRAQIEVVRVTQNVEVSRMQEQNSAAGQAIRARTDAQQAVERLTALELRRGAEQEKLRNLVERRRALKADYLLQREKISTTRESTASDLQRKIGDCVRVRIMRNADSLAYQQILSQGLRGARVRNHDEILAGLMRLRPEQIAQIIQDNDVDEFEDLVAFGRERSARILEAFRSSLDPLAVEVIDIEDRISIELNVANSGQPHFKDAAELSQGQKCTALLPLLLSRREMPLLIDQPEDNLDNHFIYETVVDAVRRLREVRQMIFITHNANIPVLGEADLVVVMNSDGKKGYVQKVGTVDECQDEIVDLLEGGRQAFEARSKRYGRK
jgi:energy-coupling factor transporter ATP-binding protein EcfA2